MGERALVFLLLFFTHSLIVLANTANPDYTALLTLMSEWDNTPPNWVGSNPCGGWDGIECTNSRITSISLASMSLSGQLTSDIGLLSELVILDLSYNKNLTGPLPDNIGKLRKLRNLLLINCGFTGPIPATIGNLERLVFLSLNSNGFTGPIPAAIGNLSNVYWLDLAENQLEGPIPISNGTTPGLDMMYNTKHFHFGVNKLSGNIPAELFSSKMSLIHVLFESNRFTGSIPSTLGLVKSLEVVRFDNNFFSGSLPENINNLTSVRELFLSNNRLSGSLPNLTGMNSLRYLDMSNNSFDPSNFPLSLSTLPALTTIMMENTKLQGAIPVSLFNLQQLQTVVLKNNQLNGTLDIGTSISDQLDLLDLQINYIEEFKPQIDVSKVNIILLNNPICQETGIPQSYCSIATSNNSYSTPPENCVPVPCSLDQTLSPKCKCAYPYTGTLNLRAPSFSDLGNETVYVTLQLSLVQSFQHNDIPVDSVSLSNPRKNTYQYLELTLKVFPSGQDRFNRTGISSLAFILSNQTYKPPSMFGPYYFTSDDYENFMNDTVLEGPVTTSSKSSNTGIIAGAAAGGAALLVLILVLFVYALQRKNKPVKATGKHNPFEQWGPDDSSSSIPQLKGARCFSFEEIQNCTKNFSQVNNIGSGGYGKVYRGTLPNGQLIAVKRAQKESMQGGLEFKTEIELLSRVHHKNLVSLIGFCFEQGEQMLIYEYVANGTLKDTLLEYYMTQQLTEKSDVYSFGVLMLELITARRPIERGKYIVKVVKGAIDKTKGFCGLEEVLDPTIELGTALNGFEKFVDLALQCVEESSSDRPSMNYVVKEIENMLQLAGSSPILSASVSTSSSYNNPTKVAQDITKDLEVLKSLSESWQGQIQNWEGSDPCSWYGINCRHSRVVSISLTDIGLTGELSGDIGSLSELDNLDLSNNRGLIGPLPREIGNLKKLTKLTLVGCGFTGRIPDEIGSLQQLEVLSLNSNNFAGSIPPSIGNLSNLTWLDLADNQLDGSIPVSSGTTPGLDMIFHCNLLVGSIPETLGLVTSLTVVRFENNSLNGHVPQSFNNLINVTDLLLSNNKLEGAMPNLTGMNSLRYFVLKDNHLGGTLDIGTNYSRQLRVIDLRSNSIQDYKQSNDPPLIRIMLAHNPICTENGAETLQDYCTNLDIFDPKQQNNCQHGSCSPDQTLSPNCKCGYPYTGTLTCRAPSYFDWSNTTNLEEILMKEFQSHHLPVDSVSLTLSTKDPFRGFEFIIQIFPLHQNHFSQQEQSSISFLLGNRSAYSAFDFIAGNHVEGPKQSSNSSSTAIIIGVAIGGSSLLLVLLALAGFYAFRQRRRAERAISRSNPFGNWDPSKSNCGTPQLKAPRQFSFKEIQKYTNNFSQANDVGSGGYGKGYLDPDYYTSQRLTEKSDVYSFGVLMLELITAKRPIERGKYIVKVVRNAIDKTKDLYGLHETIDPAICSGSTLEGFEKFVDLAMECLQDSGVDRPTMSEVVKEIEEMLRSLGLNLTSELAASSSSSHRFQEVSIVSSQQDHLYSNESVGSSAENLYSTSEHS
ncbi:hypothetical protein V8G54_033762 [Vigna mungo]|uniref:non-specific serine/threonine protein kinase n=1 Tax=Vigna mungo TaxID=3915 RepID=A0AAQ3MNH6_VIGMU